MENEDLGHSAHDCIDTDISHTINQYDSLHGACHIEGGSSNQPDEDDLEDEDPDDDDPDDPELDLPGGDSLSPFSVEENSIQEAMKSNRDALEKRLLIRRPIEQLVDQGIYPSLKTPPAFAKQWKQLERAKTGDLLRRKLQQRPDRNSLVQFHILEDTSVDPSIQEKQRALKRARLQDSLSDKLLNRPGPLELVERNILPTAPLIQDAVKEGKLQYIKSTEIDDPHRRHYMHTDEFEDDSQSEAHPSEASLASPNSASWDSSFSEPRTPVTIPPPPPPPELSPFLQKLPNFSAPSGLGSPGFTLPMSRSSSGCFSKGKKKSKSSGSGKSGSSYGSAKTRQIKFHEYKGPPSASKGQEEESTEPHYNILLRQQQLFLQLQLEEKGKSTHLKSPSCTPTPSGRSTPVLSPLSSVGTTPSLVGSSDSSFTFVNKSLVSPTVVVGSGAVQVKVIGPAVQQSSSLSGIGPTVTVVMSENATPPVLVKCLSSTTVATASHRISKLDDLKVADLKAECKKRNLPVSGPKTNLLHKLAPYTDEIIAFWRTQPAIAKEASPPKKCVTSTTSAACVSATPLTVGSSFGGCDEATMMPISPGSPNNSVMNLNASLASVIGTPLSPDQDDPMEGLSMRHRSFSSPDKVGRAVHEANSGLPSAVAMDVESTALKVSTSTARTDSTSAKFARSAVRTIVRPFVLNSPNSAFTIRPPGATIRPAAVGSSAAVSGSSVPAAGSSIPVTISVPSASLQGPGKLSMSAEVSIPVSGGKTIQIPVSKLPFTMQKEVQAQVEQQMTFMNKVSPGVQLGTDNVVTTINPNVFTVLPSVLSTNKCGTKAGNNSVNTKNSKKNGNKKATVKKNNKNLKATATPSVVTASCDTTSMLNPQPQVGSITEPQIQNQVNFGSIKCETDSPDPFVASPQVFHDAPPKTSADLVQEQQRLIEELQQQLQLSRTQLQEAQEAQLRHQQIQELLLSRLSSVNPNSAIDALLVEQALSQARLQTLAQAALQGNSSLTPDQLRIVLDLISSSNSSTSGHVLGSPGLASVLQKPVSGPPTDRLVEVINTKGLPEYVLTSKPSVRNGLEPKNGSYSLAKTQSLSPSPIMSSRVASSAGSPAIMSSRVASSAGSPAIMSSRVASSSGSPFSTLETRSGKSPPKYDDAIKSKQAVVFHIPENEAIDDLMEIIRQSEVLHSLKGDHISGQLTFSPSALGNMDISDQYYPLTTSAAFTSSVMAAGLNVDPMADFANPLSADYGGGLTSETFTLDGNLRGLHTPVDHMLGQSDSRPLDPNMFFVKKEETGAPHSPVDSTAMDFTSSLSDLPLFDNMEWDSADQKHDPYYTVDHMLVGGMPNSTGSSFSASEGSSSHESERVVDPSWLDSVMASMTPDPSEPAAGLMHTISLFDDQDWPDLGFDSKIINISSPSK